MIFLVTGGCGYIGSHIVVKLAELGYDVIVVDKREIIFPSGGSIKIYRRDILTDNLDDIFGDLV